MNLLDAGVVAGLTANRGEARAHLERLHPHEPPFGVAYRALQAICFNRRDANSIFWRWVNEETGGQAAIARLEASEPIEVVHERIREQLAADLASRSEPADAPIRYARIADLFLRHLASCEVLSLEARSHLTWEAPVPLEAAYLRYLRRFVPALILGEVCGDAVDNWAAYRGLQALVREITLRAGVPNGYFAAMAEIEAGGGGHGA